MRRITQPSSLIAGDSCAQPHLSSILMLQWLTFISVSIFATWMAWHFGFVQNIVKTDITRLSVVIAALFLGGTTHCALRCSFLSAQSNELIKIIAQTMHSESPQNQRHNPVVAEFDNSPIAAYISSALRYRRSDTPEDAEQKLRRSDEILLEHLKGPHETGWFLTGTLVKLGLLGTVIGFILMLSSVSSVVTLDPSQIHLFFSEMTHGMRVALNTTLVGLLGTMLLGAQYLLLDRGADKLLANAIHFIETVRF